VTQLFIETQTIENTEAIKRLEASLFVYSQHYDYVSFTRGAIICYAMFKLHGALSTVSDPYPPKKLRTSSSIYPRIDICAPVVNVRHYHFWR